MRSFILTPAFAAALATTSLAPALAGPHATMSIPTSGFVMDNSLSPARPAMDSTDHRGTPQLAEPTGSNAEGKTGIAATEWPMHRNTRLSTIENELGTASRRVDVDRSHGRLSAREAGIVRGENAAILNTAMEIAARHEGGIPDGSFATLQRRVARLDRQIAQFASA